VALAVAGVVVEDSSDPELALHALAKAKATATAAIRAERTLRSAEGVPLFIVITLEVSGGNGRPCHYFG
jgi:hypothetical protein